MGQHQSHHLVEQALAACPAGQGWLVAFSGGLDSAVLLWAAHRVAAARDIPLRAVHVHHGLSDNADTWLAHCASFCDDLNVPFEAVKVKVSNQGEGLEAAARDERYHVFEQSLRKDEQLLLAHHRDDQAETLLLRLMRGTGPEGLTGMVAARPLGQGQLQRPLLSLSRSDLEAYARSQQVSWIEDESNASLDFDRNYLRHQVMPLLEARWPNFAGRWQATAELCGQAAEAQTQMAGDDFARCNERAESWGWSVDLSALASLAAARRQSVLRYWVALHHGATPEHTHLNEVNVQLMDARQDAAPVVSWGKGEDRVCLRRFAGRLYLLPGEERQPPVGSVAWAVPEPLSWGNWQLTLAPTAPGDPLALSLPEVVHVTCRQGGERCKPADRAHSQTLKKLLQERGIEPWLRPQLPLIYVDDALAAVADYWVCDGFAAGAQNTPPAFEGEQKPVYRLYWRRCV